MTEKVIIQSLSPETMSSSVQKTNNVDTSVSDKAPLTEALNHIDMAMKQQADELAGKSLVSHVPVSIVIESRSSSSTLCSLSTKEGSENGDIVSLSSPTHFTPQIESKKKEAKILPSRIDSQGSTSRADNNKIQSPPKTNNINLPSAKSVSVTSANSAINVSPESAPSITTNTRPAKKPRTISTCSSSKPTQTCATDSSKTTKPQDSSLLLLARDEDEEHLSPLHVFVRKQIEVFTATPRELSQPAPGRKQPIQLHQVGLRCIHCRSLSSVGGARKTRVKRAVCYPSAVGRIYHSVSDMKFDHFSHCKLIPQEVRKTFETLKAEGKSQKEKLKTGKNKSSSSSTAKYYRESASRMGLVDGPGGIIYMNTTNGPQHPAVSSQKVESASANTPSMPQQLLQSPSLAQTLFQQQQQQQEEFTKLLIQQQSLATFNSAAVASMLFPPVPMSSILAANTSHLTSAMNSTLLQSLLMNAVAAGANAQKSIDAAIARASEQQKVSPQRNPRKRSLESAVSGRRVLPLAAPGDANDLNPLHCFVRKHVELFSADKSDTEAPCPGRKTRVTLGQVGIRCKHCARLNLKPRERVKRAVCYPPSIDGIYHSVSNMKFDHFGICPSLPPDAKKDLATLRSTYSGRNIGSTNTARYYRDSAVSKGLVDTEKGIRFRDDATSQMVAPSSPLAAAAAAAGSLEAAQAPTGISALMMAAASHATSI